MTQNDNARYVVTSFMLGSPEFSDLTRSLNRQFTDVRHVSGFWWPEIREISRRFVIIPKADAWTPNKDFSVLSPEYWWYLYFDNIIFSVNFTWRRVSVQSKKK